MSAWVSKEQTVDGKVKRVNLASGVKGVTNADRFVVMWRDPDRRVKQKRIPTPGKVGKRLADELAQQITAKLTLGTYEDRSGATWKDFRRDFDRRFVSEKAAETQRIYGEALTLFESLCKPNLVRSITTMMVDEYRTKLRQRKGIKKGTKLSPASVNKHLRHLRTALRRAHAWEYLRKMPDVTLMREPIKEPVPMEPDHFDDIYGACEVAKYPQDRHYTAGQWWQSLMVVGIMTGLRISEMLTILWDDVHLDDGWLLVRHNRSNKAKRDDVVPLHPVAVEHLRKLTDIGQSVFDWPMCKRALFDQWHTIQRAAGIELPCHEDHDCTPTCHAYGFHSLKKALRHPERSEDA